MSKLSLDALKERAEAVASQDLLNAISGGTENACHDGQKETKKNEKLKKDVNRLLDEVSGYWLWR